ncbi:hypothetical protein LNAOJCKE_4930 [Methylorubrum aminovorans]|uniref:Uncharacterized protein n=1 Tax=Methylorubrum aminovorans TaxID=269069 RepID=A0ABQ4UKZ2_9HYPH|nr:hypothetical protein [Methylorubrum aminovorans]GJE67698.1 hypothetical protein LNAOJCKE_4930 [Methylorubrum aminovorans]GMA79852.1 hypothetical protein GCM10025880_62690 [Methylorubrum aminovorans]GMA80011.1 hypothetical protein GCM10025880_64280 [Methylorubrum aminovorans]
MTDSSVTRRHLEEIARLLGLSPSAFRDPAELPVEHLETLELLDLWNRLACSGARRRVLDLCLREIEETTPTRQ